MADPVEVKLTTPIPGDAAFGTPITAVMLRKRSRLFQGAFKRCMTIGLKGCVIGIFLGKFGGDIGFRFGTKEKKLFAPKKICLVRVIFKIPTLSIPGFLRVFGLSLL